MRRSLIILVTFVTALFGFATPATAATPSPPTGGQGNKTPPVGTADRLSAERQSLARYGLTLDGAGRITNATGSTRGTARHSHSPATTAPGKGQFAHSHHDDATGSSHITFDEYPVGTVVTDQYSPEGVDFSGPSGDTPVFISGDGSDPNTPALSGTPLFNGPVYATFVKPGTSTPVTVNNFSVNIGYIDDPGSTQVLVYSTNGTQVLTTDYTGYGTLTSTIGNVYGFRIEEVSEEDNGFSVDDLIFTPGSSPVSGLVGGALAASETYGGSNPAEPLCDCSVGWGGDPVNTSNGDLAESVTDIAVHGNGPGLTAARTYNSLATSTKGVFGNGWSSLLDMGVAVDPATADATVTQASGATVTFIPTPAGYGAATRISATLTGSGTEGYSFVTRDHLTYTFSPSGQLTSVADRNGYAVTFDRSAKGAITATDPSGRSLTFVLDNGRVVSATDPAGATVHYRYDARGNLNSVSDRLGETTTYSYDASNRLTSITDPTGSVGSDRYDTSGRVVKQTDARGGVTTFDYTTIVGTTKITDPDGHITLDRYSGGLLTQRTSGFATPAAATTSYRYDPLTGGISQVTDPDGHTTSRTYDANGNVLTVVDATGATTTRTYNAFNEPTSVTDPLGNTTIYSYDGSGNLLTVATPLTDGTTVEVQYTYGNGSTAGDVTAQINPDGHSATFTYDQAGDRLSSTDAAGSLTTNTFDQDGRLLTTVTPTGRTTSYVYDAEGRQTRATDPLGGTTGYTYDGDGRRVSATDPRRQTTTYSYDKAGNVTKTTAADGSVTSATYDADGNTLTKTDANGHTRTYTYDSLGRSSTSTDALGAVTTYGYDSDGNLTTTVDSSGRKTTRSFDADSRLTSITYSDGATHAVGYTYDADGHRLSMTDGTGTTRYSYDALGDTTSKTDGHGSTTAFTYDAARNATTITYPNGRQVQRGYDADERLTSVTDWSGNVARFSYDADGNLTTTGYGSAATVTNTYDADGRLASTGASSTTAGPLAALAYSRDADGNVTKETDSGALTASRTLVYNSSNRLTGDNATSYRYDAAGNPVSFEGASQTVNAADEVTQSASSAGVTTYAYDASGERTSATSPTASTTYGYDGAGNLTSLTYAVVQPAVLAVSPSSGPTAGGTTVTITGTGFTAGASVLVGGVPATGIKVSSGTSITATTPEGTGTVDITVSTAQGTSPTTAADRFTYTGTSSQLPIISKVSPAYGPLVGGVTVTITGSNISSTTSVFFGSKKASIIKVAAGLVTASAPAGSGTVDVRVSTAKGTSATTVADHFTYLAPPSVSSVSPTTVRPGTKSTFMIVGTGLLHASKVTIGSTTAAIVTDSDTLLAAVATLPKGTYKVTVTTPGGSAVSRATVTVKSAGASVSATDEAFPDAAAATGTAPHAISATYSYDGDGLRASKSLSGGATTYFSYDTTSSLPRLLSDGSTSYIYGPGGLPIEQISPTGAIDFYLHDQLGSTRALIGTSGTITGVLSYSAYGVVTSSGTDTTPLTFAGGYRDSESGLLYLVHRYLDGSTGGFLSADALVALTQAAYRYANGNPLSAIDPLGLDWWNPTTWSGTTWAAVGVAVALVAVGVATAGVGDVVLGSAAITTETAVEASTVVAAEDGAVVVTEAATVTTTVEASLTVDNVVTGLSYGAAVGGGLRGAADTYAACQDRLASVECVGDAVTTAAGVLDPFLRLSPGADLLFNAANYGATRAVDEYDRGISC